LQQTHLSVSPIKTCFSSLRARVTISLSGSVQSCLTSAEPTMPLCPATKIRLATVKYPYFLLIWIQIMFIDLRCLQAHDSSGHLSVRLAIAGFVIVFNTNSNHIEGNAIMEI
jgi:hypothetical protein